MPKSQETVSDATKANYPALKHFFPCNDGAGTYELEDVVGGIKLNSHTYTAYDANGITTTFPNDSWHPVGGHQVPFASGTLGLDRTLPTLMFCCAIDNNYLQVGIGYSGDDPNPENTGSEEFMLSSSFFLGNVTSDLQSASAASGAGTDLSNTIPSMVGAYYYPSVDITAFHTDTTGDYIASAPASLAGMPLAPNYSDVHSFASPSSMAALYGWAIFQFADGIPSDIAIAMEWMRAEWLRGNKAIYPGWRGLL